MISSSIFLQRIPLTVKMVLLTVLLGGSIGVVANHLTTAKIKKMFENHLFGMLEQTSLENRIRFDNYLNDFRSLATLFASNENLLNHLDTVQQVPNDKEPVRYKYYPDWFPSRSLIRSLAIPRFFLIYSKDHQLLETYYANHEKNIPESLFNLDPLTIDKSTDVTHITSINDEPFIISTKTTLNTKGDEFFLVIASPIDELFFLQIRGEFPLQMAGLMNADKDRILSSSDNIELPSGTTIEEFNTKFLTHFHQFHEYGGAETQIHFASFTPREQITKLTNEFMQQIYLSSIIIILSIVVSSALLMYFLSLRIERITSRIKKFSSDSFFNKNFPSHTEKFHGDQLTLLDKSFTILTAEVEKKTSQLQTANNSLHESINELLETRAELLKAEKMAVVGQMSGIIAHELLNPITSILIRVEKNIEYGEQALQITDKLNQLNKDIIDPLLSSLDKTQRGILEENFAHFNTITDALAENQKLRLDDLNFLENELGKVVSIIDNFRQMSRKERIIEDVNPVDVIKEVLDELEDQLEKRHINLSVDIQPIPLLRGDFMEFHSIVTNLMTNAMHAIESKGKGDTDDIRLINISMKPNDKAKIEIIIQDTGKGITPEEREKIFDPSYTTKGRDGTGFGLAISRKIARSYNGDVIVLDSQLEKGATFLVLLGDNNDKR